ncbi:branched-chain amino acid transport system permease protein [Rhizobium alvei]
MSMIAYACQQALNAVPLAALYALLAFGYALTFGLTRRAEFTAGALFAFSGQLFVLLTAFGWNRLWLIYPAALAFGGIAAFIYTLVVARLIGRQVTGPLLARAPNALIVASLAVMIILMELVRLAAESRSLWISPVLNERIIFAGEGVAAVVLTKLQILNALIMGGVVLFGSFLLSRTRAGRNWRAVADDRLAARLMGVDDARLVMLTGMATAALVAIAGIFGTAYYGNMDFGAGLLFGLKVVMIASLGEQTSPIRSALGAALYGAIETFWGAYLPFEWRDAALFSGLVLLAVLFRKREQVV